MIYQHICFNMYGADAVTPHHMRPYKKFWPGFQAMMQNVNLLFRPCMIKAIDEM